MNAGVDMRTAIVPKSDQLNADDLIGGPITIAITGVTVAGGKEQPVSVFYEGDNGKPYKPCKSMCRVMVHLWGPDAGKYAGQSLTLYRDPSVKWGGLAVGGIRISHASGIDHEVSMALTETKGKYRQLTVKTLARARPAPPAGTQRGADVPTLDERAARFEATLVGCKTQEERDKAWSLSTTLRSALDKADPDRLAELEALFNRLGLPAEPEAPADGFPGDREGF